MFVVTVKSNKAGNAMKERSIDEANGRGRSGEGLVPRLLRWWVQRCLRQHRRAAKRQLFLVETMVLGPKQKVYLMKCGEERFLVGTGPDGVTSMVRVGETLPGQAQPVPVESAPSPPIRLYGGERWG
jgi:hypothetical protein